MKRFAVLACALCLGLTAAGCTKDSDTPVSPTTTNALTFGAQMAAALEVPPVTNTEAQAVCRVSIVLTPAATGTGYVASFTIAAGGFPATSVFIAGHIHSGAAGVNGPPVVDTGLSVAAPLLTPTGSLLITLSGIPVSNEVAQAINANPTGYYFNLHSPLNPGGVIRGQLVKQ